MTDTKSFSMIERKKAESDIKAKTPASNVSRREDIKQIVLYANLVTFVSIYKRELKKRIISDPLIVNLFV